MKGIVACVLATTAFAGDLKLTWQDCGDASTHAKITGFTPGSLTTGQTASMVGTGNLDEDVAGASFDVEMDGVIQVRRQAWLAQETWMRTLPVQASMWRWTASSTSCLVRAMHPSLRLATFLWALGNSHSTQ